MQNTGKEYLNTERKPTMLPEFAELLPPLSDEQLSLLEADILKNGCYAPIIVNEDMIIVDGHNRFNLCEKHGIPYRTAVFSFADDLEAKQWALDTQKSRRNLSVNELCKIALKLRPDVEARAKENMSAGGGDQKSDAAKSGLATLPNPISPIDTRKELATAVGVGERTMGKAMKIEDDAPQAVKDAVDDGTLSVNQGYKLTKELCDLPEEEQDTAAAEAIAREIDKYNDKRKQISEDTKIARLFCNAFEKGVQIEPSEKNIRIWVENAGIKFDHLDSMIKDAKQISENFTKIAEILENTIKKTDWRQKIDEE